MNEENYLDLAHAALDMALSKGCEVAEAYVQKHKELTIEARGGEVETIKQAGDRGLGIRVIKDSRAGFAFTTKLDREGIREAVDMAHTNASNCAPDEHLQLPAQKDTGVELDLYDPAVYEVSVEKKIEQAILMEKIARGKDPRIKNVESSTYQDEEEEITVANTSGLSCSYRVARFALYLSLVAGTEDDTQTGFALSQNLRYQALDAEKVAGEAVDRSLSMLGAAPVESGEVTVLLDPYVMGGFLGLMASALSGDAVLKGRSLFAGRTGQQVASDLVTLIDDGTMPGGIASAPVDGEGVPTQKSILIRQGKLEGFLHNTRTASRSGLKSTGNAVRGSFKSTPEVGVTNFYLQPGDADLQGLMSGVEKGFLVTSVMGMHTANPVSGDFSVGASGLWIKNGRIDRPVRGVAIAGNIMDLLTSIDKVANDLKFIDRIGSPTVRVSRLAVSGL